MKVLKMREYEKNGKSEKYKYLKDKFNQKMKKQALLYKEKVLNCAYSALRRLGARSGENSTRRTLLLFHLTPTKA